MLGKESLKGAKQNKNQDISSLWCNKPVNPISLKADLLILFEILPTKA